MPIDKEKCLVGMEVQDSNGNVGKVRWIGRIEKNQKPPNKDVGTYAAVEFPNPLPNASHRCNGTWEGQKYCEAPEGTVELHKPKSLDPERNREGVRVIREKFGERVKDFSDYQIVKFLIARKYEIPKVVEMLDNHLKWREQFKPSADECFPPEMADFYPIGFGDGLDRENSLLYFERPGNAGKCHPKDFVKMFGIPRISRWHASIMQDGVERLHAHPTAKRITTVVDLSNLGDSDKQVINFGKAIAKIDQDNYPEHLNKMFIINAPTVFTGIWKLIRLFVDDRTKAKIHVLGKDWQSEVSKQIDQKYWPSFMGGTDDSWLKKGGRHGSDDPAKTRDPETGALNLEEVTDEQIEAAAKASPTPQQASPQANDSPAEK
jgi:hypothetical protein